MPKFDDKQYAVVRALLPTTLGIEEHTADDSRIIDEACERLSAFFGTLDRLDTSPRATQLLQLLTALHVIIELDHLKTPNDLGEQEIREFTAKLFTTDEGFWRRLLGFLEAPFKHLVPTQIDIARSLREMFAVAYYSGQETFATTGYVPVWERPDITAAMPELQRPIDNVDIEAVLKKHAEGRDVPASEMFADDGRPKVAIIGSGAGGAVMAARLAKSGKYDVAVFEAGPGFSPGEYPLDPLSGMSLLLEDGLQTLTQDLDVQLLRGRCVGGSTVLTSGMTVRARASTLASWNTQGIPQGAMNAALDLVEHESCIQPLESDLFIQPSLLFRNGAEELRENVMFDIAKAFMVTNPAQHAQNEQQRKNPGKRGDRCFGCGICNYGCHFGHKLSADLTYIVDAKRDGARVHANVPIERFIAKNENGVARVTGFELKRKAGEIVEADYVVLSAGAVGSAALMLRSIDSAALRWLPCKPHIGQHLGFNFGATVVARFDEQPKPAGDAGIQISFVATKSEDSDYVLEMAFVPPGLMASLVPGVGARHRQWMKSYRSLGMTANTIGSSQSGSIDAEGNVRFSLSDGEMRTTQETLSLITRSYLRGGASEVAFAGIRGDVDADPAIFKKGDELYPEKLLDRIRTACPDADKILVASAHPQGGMRFAKSDEDGVVGEDFRVHGIANLFVADASLFPSTIVVNPQWTVMALATVAAKAVERIIESERRP